MNPRNITLLCFVSLACGSPERSAGTTDVGPRDGSTSDRDASEVDGGEESDASEQDSGAHPGRRVFITSDFFGGNLLAAVPGAADGLAAADRLCSDVAARASLGGNWRTWLSSESVDAIDRIDDLGPWSDLEGNLVFESRSRIPDGPASAIWYDETGAFLASDRIWTGTIFDGTVGPMAATCLSWTSEAMSELARIGQVGRNDDAWTFQTMTSCDQRAHLICFEQ
jgi:hypothetical protein